MLSLPHDYTTTTRRHSRQRNYPWSRHSIRASGCGVPDRGIDSWKPPTNHLLFRLCGDAGAGLPLLDAVSLAGADTGAAGLPNPRPFFDLSTDCRYLYAVYTDLAASALGWTLFAIVWSLAIAGVVFKSLAIGRFEVASAVIYLGMGWLVVFAMRPLLQAVPWHGVLWLAAGGVAYTVGILFFALDRVPYFHGIW